MNFKKKDGGGKTKGKGIWFLLYEVLPVIQ